QWVTSSTIVDGPQIVQIPANVPDGRYSIRIGLFDRATGNRIPLDGLNDGTARYILGYVTISNGGSSVTFTPIPAQVDDPRLNAAGSILNFGALQTDGMVSIRQENGLWVLRPFPRTRAFTVLLNQERFPMPTKIDAAGGDSAAVEAIPQGQYWKLPLNGAKAYSWPATNN
ncbi:MAG TPA: hypothetical protein VGM27_09970, partial [Acidobacteriaceae bacterium]